MLILLGTPSVQAQDPPSCPALLEGAAASFNIGRFQEAIDQAWTCLQQGNPVDAERQAALLVQGRATFFMGRKDDAGEMLRTLFLQYPNLVLDEAGEIAPFLAFAQTIQESVGQPEEPDSSMELALASSEVIPLPSGPDSENIPVDPNVVLEAHEVDVIPLPVGGRGAILRYVTYPDEAKANGKEGYVLVRFVVDPQGQPQEVKVMRGLGFGCDEIAVKAIQTTRFTPGTQGGQAVSVKMLMSVPFFNPR